jgi:hypothetical protein
MHRVLAVAAMALAACSFHAGAATPPGGDDDVIDGPLDHDSGTTTPPCHNTTETPALCVDFEETALVPFIPDQAPGNLNTVASTSVVPMQRNAEQAAQLSMPSKLVIPESDTLDIGGPLTIEMWINPDMMPMGPPMTHVFWMFNNNNQYGMELTFMGSVRCLSGTTSIDSPGGVNVHTWTHVACVYDGTTMKSYVDGDTFACKDMGAPPTNGHDGSAIGGNIGAGGMVTDKFIGGIDNVAVYATALSTDRICALAGHSGGCQEECTTIGGGVGGVRSPRR